ncbi:GNAT family N-acetyltransferase [Clostridium sp. Ade.TY]|uniref:GNAT family N-acetyltransferase n=1 Tax=Clostridium sp. Ade.TY TaxID=1391647 RepID=UPI00041EF746|nr:GNAT family N-acetyltransferase [Clostridium sp. Ade.TY]
MSKIIYRSLAKEDYNTVEKMICDAFGFRKFIKDEKLLNSLLTLYLQSCILESSFCKVAVKDGTVVGIILGNSKAEKNALRKPHNSFKFISNGLKLVFTNKKNRKALKDFMKIQDAYNEIIKGKKDNFEGSIQLFIVSKECRGFGVGKTLLNYLFDYMNTVNVKSLYLYTDDRCNYGFYDSQNFKRINEKSISFDSVNAKLDVFLYSYSF